MSAKDHRSIKNLMVASCYNEHALCDDNAMLFTETWEQSPGISLLDLQRLKALTYLTPNAGILGVFGHPTVTGYQFFTLIRILEVAFMLPEGTMYPSVSSVVMASSLQNTRALLMVIRFVEVLCQEDNTTVVENIVQLASCHEDKQAIISLDCVPTTRDPDRFQKAVIRGDAGGYFQWKDAKSIEETLVGFRMSATSSLVSVAMFSAMGHSALKLDDSNGTPVLLHPRIYVGPPLNVRDIENPARIYELDSTGRVSGIIGSIVGDIDASVHDQCLCLCPYQTSSKGIHDSAQYLMRSPVGIGDMKDLGVEVACRQPTRANAENLYLFLFKKRCESVHKYPTLLSVADCNSNEKKLAEQPFLESLMTAQFSESAVQASKEVRVENDVENLSCVTPISENPVLPAQSCMAVGGSILTITNVADTPVHESMLAALSTTAALSDTTTTVAGDQVSFTVIHDNPRDETDSSKPEPVHGIYVYACILEDFSMLIANNETTTKGSMNRAFSHLHRLYADELGSHFQFGHSLSSQRLFQRSHILVRCACNFIAGGLGDAKVDGNGRCSSMVFAATGVIPESTLEELVSTSNSLMNKQLTDDNCLQSVEVKFMTSMDWSRVVDLCYDYGTTLEFGKQLQIPLGINVFVRRLIDLAMQMSNSTVNSRYGIPDVYLPPETGRSRLGNREPIIAINRNTFADMITNKVKNEYSLLLQDLCHQFWLGLGDEINAYYAGENAKEVFFRENYKRYIWKLSWRKNMCFPVLLTIFGQFTMVDSLVLRNGRLSDITSTKFYAFMMVIKELAAGNGRVGVRTRKLIVKSSCARIMLRNDDALIQNDDLLAERLEVLKNSIPTVTSEEIFPINGKDSEKWFSFYYILCYPSNLLTHFVCKMLVKLRPSLLQMNVLQQKIGVCSFRSICEIVIHYGPILPIPMHVHDYSPNFFRLMTTDWTLQDPQRHSNIPMLIAVLVFLMARAEVSQRVGRQHQAGLDKDRFLEDFRLDCVTFLTHLHHSGELRFISPYYIDDGNDDEQNDMYSMIKVRMFHGSPANDLREMPDNRFHNEESQCLFETAARTCRSRGSPYGGESISIQEFLEKWFLTEDKTRVQQRTWVDAHLSQFDIRDNFLNFAMPHELAKMSSGLKEFHPSTITGYLKIALNFKGNSNHSITPINVSCKQSRQVFEVLGYNRGDNRKNWKLNTNSPSSLPSDNATPLVDTRKPAPQVPSDFSEETSKTTMLQSQVADMSTETGAPEDDDDDSKQGDATPKPANNVSPQLTKKRMRSQEDEDVNDGIVSTTVNNTAASEDDGDRPLIELTSLCTPKDVSASQTISGKKRTIATTATAVIDTAVLEDNTHNTLEKHLPPSIAKTSSAITMIASRKRSIDATVEPTTDVCGMESLDATMVGGKLLRKRDTDPSKKTAFRFIPEYTPIPRKTLKASVPGMVLPPPIPPVNTKAPDRSGTKRIENLYATDNLVKERLQNQQQLPSTTGSHQKAKSAKQRLFEIAEAEAAKAAEARVMTLDKKRTVWFI